MKVRKKRAIEELTEAIRLTVEYVGVDVLQPVEGWSWYDALVKYAPEKVAPFIHYRDMLHPPVDKAAAS